MLFFNETITSYIKYENWPPSSLK